MPKSLKPRAGARPKGTPLQAGGAASRRSRRTSGVRPSQTGSAKWCRGWPGRSSCSSATTPRRAVRGGGEGQDLGARDRPSVREVLGMAYYGVGRWQRRAHRAQGLQADHGPCRPEPSDRRLPARARAARGGRPARRRGAARPRRARRGEGGGGDRRRIGARRPGSVTRRRWRCWRAPRRVRTWRRITPCGCGTCGATSSPRRAGREEAAAEFRKIMRHDAGGVRCRGAAGGAGLVARFAFALPALAPVPREALGVHPDRTRARRSAPPRTAGARRLRTRWPRACVSVATTASSEVLGSARRRSRTAVGPRR